MNVIRSIVETDQQHLPTSMKFAHISKTTLHSQMMESSKGTDEEKLLMLMGFYEKNYNLYHKATFNTSKNLSTSLISVYIQKLILTDFSSIQLGSSVNLV